MQNFHSLEMLKAYHNFNNTETNLQKHVASCSYNQVYVLLPYTEISDGRASMLLTPNSWDDMLLCNQKYGVLIVRILGHELFI